MKPIRVAIAAAVVAGALSAAMPVLGGQSPAVAAPAAAAPDYSRVQIKTHAVAPQLYMLEGAGGNVTVLAGADATLLVDSQFAQMGPKIEAAAKALGKAPLRYLVNTHVHPDHVGANDYFAKLGLTIIARTPVRQRMLAPLPRPDGSPGAATPPAALPVFTFDGTAALHLAGQDVQLIPVAAGHTNGDLMLKLPKLDVLVVGDFYRSVGYPVIDANNGGSFAGVVAALETAIAAAGPQTKVIPGHGPLSDRAGMVAQRDILLAVRNAMAPLVAEGLGVDAVLGMKPTAAWDERVPQGAASAERFIRALHAEMSASR